jgi:multidrug efflux pump subunit AcrA (membrane-fusion protein)
MFEQKNMRTGPVGILGLFLTIGALLQGCSSTEKEPQPEVAVQVAPVKRAPIELEVTAQAVVSPLQQAIITPKITSTIRKFYVQRGSHVKAGQLLAELENADLAGAEVQSKGEFEQAEAGYATTTGASLPEQIQKAELDAEAYKAAFDAQQKIYDARKDLFSQGAIPRRDLDTAEVQLAQARSQNEQAQKQLADLQHLGKEQALKSAGAQLSAAKGKYLSAKAQLSYSEIRSPIDGVVTDRPQFQGELAAANQPLLTVMNTSKLVAKAHISQTEAVLLKVGDAAEIQLAGLEEPIKGKVMLISPALDPGSTTIEVWVEAIKPNKALKPGMSVQIAAIAKSVDDALVVPADAVYKTAEGADFVLLAGSDSKAHQTKVKVGIRNKELAEIESGVKEKDPVITAGGYALPDGTKIKVEEAPPAEAESGKEGAGGKDAADSGDKADDKDKNEKAPAEKKTAADEKSGKPAPPKGKE